MSYCLLAGVGAVAELLSALAIFALVLLVTYFTTRFVGSYEKQKMTGRNLQILESLRLSGGKCIYLVKAGDKYIVLGESRDRVDFLCEVQEDSLVSYDDAGQAMQKPDFRKLLEKAGNAIHPNDRK